MKFVVVASFLLTVLFSMLAAGCPVDGGFGGGGFCCEGEGEGEGGGGGGVGDKKELTIHIEPTSGFQRFHVPVDRGDTQFESVASVQVSRSNGPFRMAVGDSGFFTDDEGEYVQVATGSQASTLLTSGFDFGVLPDFEATVAVDVDLQLQLQAGTDDVFCSLQPLPQP